MTAIANWTHRGTLYCADNGDAEASVDGTPRRIAALDSKKVESGLTVDTANSKITVATAGDYLVMAGISFSGSNSSVYEVEIYIDTTGTGIKLERVLGAGGDVGNSHANAVLTLAAGEDVSLYQSTSDGSAMVVTNAQLSVVRLS